MSFNGRGPVMKDYLNNRGFSLVKLVKLMAGSALLFLIFIVVFPIGHRETLSGKYGIGRQNASVLASFASQWVERTIQSQDESASTAEVSDYYASLAGENPGKAPVDGSCKGQWIATVTEATNWHLSEASPDQGMENTTERTRNPIPISGRVIEQSAGLSPEEVVEDLIPADKSIVNSFNGESVFSPLNDPLYMERPVPGALALGCAVEPGETGWVYYAFGFQGTENTTFALMGDDTFHAGMGIDSIPHIRNGVFLGRFRKAYVGVRAQDQ
jgi:hypothetical protein